MGKIVDERKPEEIPLYDIGAGGAFEDEGLVYIVGTLSGIVQESFSLVETYNVVKSTVRLIPVFCVNTAIITLFEADKKVTKINNYKFTLL